MKTNFLLPAGLSGEFCELRGAFEAAAAAGVVVVVGAAGAASNDSALATLPACGAACAGATALSFLTASLLSWANALAEHSTGSANERVSDIAILP